MPRFGPWLKLCLFVWSLSAALIFIGYIRGFDQQPLHDLGLNLLVALVAGFLFDWLSGAAEDRTNGPLTESFPIPGKQASRRLPRGNPAIAHYSQGNDYARNGDLVRAIESFSKALRLDPIFVEALISRSIVLDCTGDYENAIADLSEALAIDPNNTTAYYYRGSIHSGHGNYRSAIADYDQSLLLDPTQERVRGARRLAQERLHNSSAILR